MSARSWNNSEEAKGALIAEGWKWLLHSSREIDEPRARWASSFWAPEHLIGVDRADPKSSHRFHLKTATRYSQDTPWTELDCWLGHEVKPDDSVLLDICLLGFNSVLYLLPALLKLKLKRIACFYVAPTSYAFPKDPLADLLLQSIEQPKAYIASLSYDKEKGRAKHLVFLGFDHARAWKFIAARGWKLQDVHAVLGDPAFIQDGEAEARHAAEPWLPEFESAWPEHLHNVQADDPYATKQLCQEIFSQAEWLDIVPIGPKPMALGVLWFYFGLNEKDRARVRLLYDFPTRQNPRSQGIGKLYVYDCEEMMMGKAND